MTQSPFMPELLRNTELSFLIELLLNHKLPKATKDAIAGRVREIEASPPRVMHIPYMPSAFGPSVQAASTQAILARHPDLIAAPAPVAPEVIAQTPATAMAMNQRQEAIRIAQSGIPEKGRSSPRKF